MIKLLSHMSYLTFTTSDVEASVAFYERAGLTVVGRECGNVYLRCWGDYYTYSLVIAPGDETTLSTMAWRTTSPEALDEAVRRIEAEGVQGEWVEAYRIGRAYRFTGPWGHSMTLHWDVERYAPSTEAASIFPDRPAKRSRVAGAPRQLDHVTVAAKDVDGFAEWYTRVLGFRLMARTELDQAPISIFSVLTTNEKSHDLGVVLDSSTREGRVNHYAFWVDTQEELLTTADVMMENGTGIEYGPSIHGVGEQSFLYYRDPSTLRVEVNTGGYRNYVPDWEPSTWKPSLGSASIYRNSAAPKSMLESFPAADGLSATEEGDVPDSIREALENPYTKYA